MTSRPIIPIRAVPLASASGCDACLASSAGPVCRDDLGPLCAEPALSGPQALLQRVLQGLDQDLALQVGGGLLASGLLHALHLRDDEAELTLAVAPRCGGALLADTAFQSLRRQLPDTDIYVRSAKLAG